jgi:multiple sugar transport system ATP-binding protein
MATVVLDRITKRWGAFTAVDNLSISINDLEFLVLLGPSGCGKTTTMRIVAGLEEPTDGDILIDGRRVNEFPPRDRDLAMVFQNYGLYPHMTVAQNIGYPLKVRGIPRAERENRIQAAAAKVELSQLLERRPSQLSGGQRQRVALARAIIRTPRLFLMDEPLSNLDAKLRSGMRAQLKHLQRELATTTIYVTHDQTEAMTLADRIAVLDEGRIQQLGTPAEIYARPANLFVAGFIGSPPMNLIKGRCEGDTFQHSAGSITGLQRVIAGDLVLGQRPEDLRLSRPSGSDLIGEIYSSELLGDSTLLGINSGPDLINVKVGPTEGRVLGSAVGLVFNRHRLHFFDTATGARMEGAH